jgi:hypothetical protein
LKRLFALALALFVGVGTFAQSNAWIDRFLTRDTATWGEVAWLALVGSGNLEQGATEAAALQLLQAKGWAPKTARAGELVRLDQYSFILTRSFKIVSGLMGVLLPSPRYSYRDLVALQIIPGRSDPGMLVSGTLAMQMVGRVADLSGEAR